MKPHLAVALGLLCAALAPTTAGCSRDDTKVIRYAHFQPAKADQPKHAAALAFEKYVEEQSGGSIKVEIYPASQLGDANVVLEGLKLGTIEMGVVHDGPISTMFKPFMVFAIPYLFRSAEQAWAVVDGPLGQRLAEAMRTETGVRLFGLADNGIRHFTNDDHPIRTPADMEGLKIRVMPGPIWSTLVSSLGASPSPVSWPELPSALQQGVVDGQENGVTNILAASLYQHQRYATLDGHVYSFHAYLMNDAFWSKLSDKEQQIVRDGVAKAIAIHREMTSAQDAKAGELLAAAGMEVVTLTPAEIDAFRQRSQPAVSAWVREQIGADWVDGLFEAISNADASAGR
ncbi:TRAP transporter substrate-binding protein DctP [Haliangium sp.]|uniref:TRAP transporter substrate-binding protein n=1 Tax=Haliangium sp. TaxID=2663208 RepID=UPI003D0F5E94